MRQLIRNLALSDATKIGCQSQHLHHKGTLCNVKREKSLVLDLNRAEWTRENKTWMNAWDI